MKIWKYELRIEDHQQISCGSHDVRPLSVGEQGGKLVMWARVFENSDLLDLITGLPANYENCIEVDIVGTGRPYDGDMRDFIGTVVMSYGLVWHVFARAKVINRRR